MELHLNLCYAGYEACRPRHGFGPAARTQYLLHYILSGKGWYSRGGQTYHLEAGSAFLICPGELTYYEADAAEPWEYCWVGFEGSDAQGLLEQCGFHKTPVRQIPGHQAADTLKLISRLHGENKGTGMLYTGLLYQFFSYLTEQPEPDRPTAAKDYWARAEEHIRKNYMYDITVAGVAAFVGVDRSYLYRLFQTFQNQSPQQYLIQCRVEAAKELLLETAYSVTEIAYSCGFKDIATFGRAFRSLVGATPSGFRKRTQ